MLCAFLMLVYFWGDKIILAMIKAQKLPRTQIEDYGSYKREVENIACLMGLARVEVYWAKALPADVYVLKGMGNGSCIIIGGDAFDRLSEKEINALIHFSILKIKKLNLRFIQGCNFFVFIVNLPIILMKKIKLLKLFGLFIDFFLLPLQAFKRFAFKENDKNLEELMEKLEINDVKNVIQTTLLKFQHLSFKHSGALPGILLADLTTIERKL